MPTAGWSRICPPGSAGTSADVPLLRSLPCALVLGIALTGCGSASTSQEVPESAPAEHGSYAHCLAEHGIEQPPAPGPAPGPAAPPTGVDPTAWEQALQACTELAPGPG